MIDDLTRSVEEDAETELELLEGIRVLARATALCSELSLDVDAAAPWFFSMNTEARSIGGPAPDGEYFLAMIDGRHRYRVRGRRGTSAYLGFQVLAGVGLTPRRMAAYVSDRDLDAGRRRLVRLRAGRREADRRRAGRRSVGRHPRGRVGHRGPRVHRRPGHRSRGRSWPSSRSIRRHRPLRPDDTLLGEQLTGMAWTIAKLTTLHRTIRPELLEMPNQLIMAQAAELGAADTTPDNLYMMGTFRLAPDEALVIDIDPPDSRYWSVTLENIWHECIDPRRRQSHLTNAAGRRRRRRAACGMVVAADRPGGRATGWTPAVATGASSSSGGSTTPRPRRSPVESSH